MAKVILTIEDKDDEGITIAVEFDPPIKDETDDVRPSHVAAMQVIEYLKNANGVVTGMAGTDEDGQEMRFGLVDLDDQE